MATNEMPKQLEEARRFVVHRGAVRMSESQGQISGALAAAQAEIEAAPKDHENPHFKSRYADLNSVREACRIPLAKNKIAVIQLPHAEGKTVTVTTRLAHASGEWIECDLSADAQGPGIQQIGAAITYLRRFGLSAMTGVAPDDDDDGESAMGRGAPPRPEARPAAPKKPTKREAMALDAWRMIKDLGRGDEKAMRATAVKCFGKEADDDGTWIDLTAPLKVMEDGLDKLRILADEAKKADDIPF